MVYSKSGVIFYEKASFTGYINCILGHYSWPMVFSRQGEEVGYDANGLALTSILVFNDIYWSGTNAERTISGFV